MAAVARANPFLAAFTVTYLVGFFAVGVGIHSDLAPSYLVVVSLLVVVVSRIDQRFELGARVLWALSVWGFVHMAGGIVPLDGGRILYNAWLVPHLVRYDQAVHAFGFGYATVACAKVLRHLLPVAEVSPAMTRPSRSLTVMAALGGMGMGALNEVVEFLATLVLAHTNVGGFENTGWDLVYNLLGATVACMWLTWSRTWPPGAPPDAGPDAAEPRSKPPAEPAIVGS